MDIYILGLALYPAKRRVTEERLEEMVFSVTRHALDDAGVERAEIEQVTLAGSDELDGRSISSMLLAMPAGAYLRDEMKCTDSSLTGLCLGAMRLAASFARPVPRRELEQALDRPVRGRHAHARRTVLHPPDRPQRRHRRRPVRRRHAAAHGFNETMARDAVLDYAAPRRAQSARRRPADALRALHRQLALHRRPASRQAHCAPRTDGGVAMVLATGDWLARHQNHAPRARLAGLGWSVDAYDLGRDRLTALKSFRDAYARAATMAGTEADDLDVFELDCQTGYHAAAYRTALDGHRRRPPSPPPAAPSRRTRISAPAWSTPPKPSCSSTTTPEPIQRPNPRCAAAHQAPRLRPARQRRRHFRGSLTWPTHTSRVVGIGHDCRSAPTTPTTTTSSWRKKPPPAPSTTPASTPDEIDAIVFSMAPTQFMGVNDCDRWAIDSRLGRRQAVHARLHAGGATGGSALPGRLQSMSPRGIYRSVLVVGADRVAETPDAQHILNLIWDRFYEHDFALNTVTMTALAAQRYMARYGTTEEQFARVVVRARKNADGQPVSPI